MLLPHWKLLFCNVPNRHRFPPKIEKRIPVYKGLNITSPKCSRLLLLSCLAYSENFMKMIYPFSRYVAKRQTNKQQRWWHILILSIETISHTENQYIHISLRWRHNERDGVSNHPRLDLLSRLFRRRSKKTSKLCVTGLNEGKSPVTGEFPAQRASNAENVSIWWRHHVSRPW